MASTPCKADRSPGHGALSDLLPGLFVTCVGYHIWRNSGCCRLNLPDMCFITPLEPQSLDFFISVQDSCGPLRVCPEEPAAILGVRRQELRANCSSHRMNSSMRGTTTPTSHIFLATLSSPSGQAADQGSFFPWFWRGRALWISGQLDHMVYSVFNFYHVVLLRLG